jgi:hypothetical protein
MLGGARLPPNPQAAMARRPRPEDAANHITVRSYKMDSHPHTLCCFCFYSILLR